MTPIVFEWKKCGACHDIFKGDRGLASHARFCPSRRLFDVYGVPAQQEIREKDGVS